MSLPSIHPNARSPSKVVIDISSQGGSPPIGLRQSGTVGAPSVASSSIAQSSPLLQHTNKSSHDSSPLPAPSFEVDSSNVNTHTKDSSSWTQRILIAPFKRRVLTPLMAILKSGATPEGLALSFAFGLTGGVFPVPATTTIICVAFVFIFKLNLAMVQLVNLLMTPINLATFMSFIRWGEYLFGAQPVALSLEPFKESPLRALGDFWISLCYGVVAWSIFTPPATFILYQLFKPILRRAMSGISNVKTAAD
jgi:uncharacterized protein (DUF2062 family)